MTGSVNLGDDLESFIDRLVGAGFYESREEVLKHSIRLLQTQDRRLSDLDDALARGLAQSEAGLGTPIEEVMAKFEAKYASRMKQRSA